MVVEIFTKSRFEEVLADIAAELDVIWFHDGVTVGEHHYHLLVVDTFDAYKKPDDDYEGMGIAKGITIEIRSSVGIDKLSAAAGQDSIRVWFADIDGKPLGSKAKRWITRVTGWEKRLSETISNLTAVALKVKLCPDCGKIPGLFLTKKDGPNKGRWLSKCKTHGHFTWLSDPLAKHKPIPTLKDPKPGTSQQRGHTRADENEIVYECVICKFKCLKCHLVKVGGGVLHPIRGCPMCGGSVIAKGSLVKQEKGGE